MTLRENIKFPKIEGKHQTMQVTPTPAATTTAQRQQKVEDLLWALFNKVDFVFNY